MGYMLTSEDHCRSTKDLIWTKLKSPDNGMNTQPSELYPTLKRANKEEIPVLLLGALSNTDAYRQKGKMLAQKVISRVRRNPDLFFLLRLVIHTQKIITLTLLTL